MSSHRTVVSGLFVFALSFSCGAPDEGTSYQGAQELSTVAIASLSLINTDTNSAVPGYASIPNNATFDLALLPEHLAIRANTSPSPLGSVSFQLNPGNYSHTEHNLPYDLCDDGPNGALPCAQLATLGNYTLVATPFSSAGQAGTPASISFSVTRGGGPDAGSDAGSTTTARLLYAVNQTGKVGSISVYDLDAGHKLVKTISTVANFGLARGVAANAQTGKLFVSYNSTSGAGMIYALDLYNDAILWNKVIPPDVDRLAMSPDGRFLYVPTSENQTNPVYNFINIVDAATGNITGKVTVAGRTHDALYPLSGPIVQECKMTDGTCNYLYTIDPVTLSVAKVGHFANFLGPFSVDSTSTYAAVNVFGVYGMQVANLKTGQTITVTYPGAPLTGRLPHGIGWTPDQTEVWESVMTTSKIGIWNMANPLAPTFSMFMPISSNNGSHWLTFSIKGEYGYISPAKSSPNPTEVFDVKTHTSLAKIGSSEDLLEVDFTNGTITQVGDQYGIGRK